MQYWQRVAVPPYLYLLHDCDGTVHVSKVANSAYFHKITASSTQLYVKILIEYTTQVTVR
jgi:hypothetical protein